MIIPKSALIVAFERVCELKTLHATASDMGLTQVAITKRIQALEESLGVTLFLRSRRGMTLTDEGQSLLHYCKSIREAEGELVTQLKPASRKEISLKVIGPTSFISSRLPVACEKLYQKYPFLRLHFRAADHGNLIEVLRRGEADFAIVPPTQVPNEMSSKVLKSDRYLLVGCPAWRSRSIEDILREERIIDFYESDETTMRYLRSFGLDKFPQKNRLFINQNEALSHYISLGIGFGTLTESVAKSLLERRQIVRLNGGKTYEDPLALAWLPRTRPTAFVEDIIRSVK